MKIQIGNIPYHSFTATDNGNNNMMDRILSPICMSPPIVSKSGRFVCGLSLWVVGVGLLYVLRLCKINLSESTSLFHHFLIPFHFIRSNKFVILADANNRVLLYVIVSQTSVSTSSLSRLGWRWAQWLSVDSIFTHFQTTATNLSISPLLDVNPIWYGDEEQSWAMRNAN